MNKLRRTCAAMIITAVVTVPAFAGILDSPGVVSPPPSTPTTSTSTSSTMTMILTILDLIRG